MTLTRPEVDASVESPYAAELRRGDPGLRFSPAVEAEFERTRLMNHRMLIRMACALTVLVAVFRVVENMLGGSWPAAPFFFNLPALGGAVIAGSAALAWIAFSPAFERWYLPVASILIPARNIVSAAPVAAAAAHGHLEMLMLMPLMVLGPFFFLGLPWRTALISVALAIASFTASALWFDLPPPVLLRTGVFVLCAAAACTVAARELERSARKSFLESRLIADLAQHDPLTGTKNRRVFDEHLARLWRQAVNDRRNFAIVLVDVDHFKAYNDRYGHQAGDQALRRIAQTLQTFACRPLDLLARYGGEEFGAILYDIDGAHATDIADRMRRAVAALAIEHRDSATASAITISIGVATVRPSNDRNTRGALQLADEALYKAKTAGRNRVEVLGQAEYGALVTGMFSVNALKPGRQ